MKKRTSYIFCLWVATLSVLLSTVMTHHHHMGRVCMIEERCEQDGSVNDEHTEHHDEESEGDRENCSVRQMHHFVTNAKVVKSLKKLIFEGSQHLMAAHFSAEDSMIPCFSLLTVRWQQKASTLSDGLPDSHGRRGPPMFFC